MRPTSSPGLMVIGNISFTFLIVLLVFLGLLNRQNFSYLNFSIYQNYSNFSNKFLTLITIPSPTYSTKYKLKLHLYALNSWTRRSDVEVLLFTNELNDTIKQLYPKEVKLIDHPLKVGPRGNPLVRDWFIQGLNHSTTDYVAFINSDIIVPDRWFEVTKNITRIFKEDTFIGIHRVNLDEQNESLLDTPYDKIEEVFLSREHYPLTVGADIYVFSRHQKKLNFTTIPNFEVGYCTWDNYIIGMMMNLDYAINYQGNPPVFHLDHGKHKCTSESRIFERKICAKKYNDCVLKTTRWLKWKLDNDSKAIVNQRNTNEIINLY